MIVYILKFSACLLLFLTVYKLVLEKENMHVFKRFYLLGILLLSVGIPLITFTYYIEPIVPTNSILVGETFVQNTVLPLESKANYLAIILWSIYGLGVFLFGIKFIRNLYKIVYKIKHNPKQKVFSITHVLLSDLIVPHTFFKYIFFNKQKFEAQEIPEEVLWHEETHAKQKHSIDVLFIELLQVLFWFNPLVYLTKHVIKLNHEFLADQGALNRGIGTTTYQEILLAFSSSASQPQLANAINYSLIKKRFTVMKTQTTKKGIWLRSLILLPLLALTLYSFSNKVVIEKAAEKDLTTNLAASSNLDTALQEKATKEQIEEYNALAKKYNNMPKDDMYIKRSDIERLKYLYNLMTVSQRNKAEIFPKIPAPPAPPAPKTPKTGKPKMPPPPSPLDENATQKQIKSYKDAQKIHQAAAKAVKIKLQEQLRQEKLAYKEAQMSSKNLKVRLQKEQLRQEILAHKESQVASKVLKSKLQKEQLIQKKLAHRNTQMTSERFKHKIEKEQMRQEKLAYKENQLASKREKFKDEREQLVKVKRQYSELERKQLRQEKEAYRKDLEKVRHLKKKSDKKRSRKIKEEENTRRIPENLALREIEELEVREIQEIRLREVEEIPFEEIEIQELAPPPAPKSPREHIMEMAEKGAEFYFDDRSISSKEAIDLIRSNKDLNILTNHTDDTGFIVNLSSKPIVIDSQD